MGLSGQGGRVLEGGGGVDWREGLAATLAAGSLPPDPYERLPAEPSGAAWLPLHSWAVSLFWIGLPVFPNQL